MAGRVGAVAAVPVAAMLPVPAWACTLCHSRLAEEVRAAVFGPGFWGDAAAVASPVPVLIAAALAVRRYLP